MKILTGLLRDKKIFFKANPYLRPTADKTRKAIFDVLASAVPGKRVLDLFSGTGAMGLEAISNGAAFVSFVEKHKIQAENIRTSAKQMGVLDKCEIIAADAVETVLIKSEAGEYYDIIFIDAPYGTGLGQKAFSQVNQSRLLMPDSLIVVECAKTEDYPDPTNWVRRIKEKRYGDTKVIYFGSER